MEKRLIPLMVEHIDRNVRAFLPKEQKFVVAFDVHSSRNGNECLEQCVKKGSR